MWKSVYGKTISAYDKTSRWTYSDNMNSTKYSEVLKNQLIPIS